MKRLLLALLFLASITSCSDDDNLNPGRESFNLWVDSDIEFISNEFGTNYSIETGTHIVFQYVNVRPEDPDISDDEISDVVFFQIDSSLEEFTYTDQELEPILTHYFQGCFCQLEVTPIVTGTVSGEKVNDSLWNASIDVEFVRGERTVQIRKGGAFRPLQR